MVEAVSFLCVACLERARAIEQDALNPMTGAA